MASTCMTGHSLITKAAMNAMINAYGPRRQSVSCGRTAQTRKAIRFMDMGIFLKTALDPRNIHFHKIKNAYFSG